MNAMSAPPDPAAAIPITATEPHLREAAAILAEMAAQVEALGARLCADPNVIARHINELQIIDLIAQKQMHLAQLLTADCPHAAIDAMSVDAVKQRMRQSMTGPA
jgi:hypothetical protein